MIRFVVFVISVTSILIIGNVASNNAKNTNKILENQNDRFTEYTVTEVKETFGKVNFSLLGTENFTLPNGIDIEEYIAPFEIPKRFVYYLAGVDEEGRPLWIAEWGKWNVKQIIENKQLRDFSFYFLQLTHRILKSISDSSTPDYPITQASFLLDFGGLNIEQILHVPTINYVVGASNMYRDIAAKHLGHSTIINANYATELLLNLLKPTFGGLFNRITVYGNNKSHWMPKILRTIPKQSVPHWYGGNKEFKPVKVYG